MTHVNRGKTKTPLRKMSLLRLLGGAAGAALLGDAAGAQTGAADEEVVVYGGRLEETIPLDLERFGHRVEILTGAELRLGGFNDLSQSLQMQVPGLYVAPKSGPFDYMNCSLQGSRCEDILWLVDGVRINNRLYNTTSPLDTIPAHAIERVEVLYGGQGILYGTQSVAGVVNVVTAAFSEAPSGTLGIGFDEYSGTHVSGDYRAARGDHEFVVYFSQDESDGFAPFAAAETQPSATDRERGYEILTLGGKYAYDFSPDARLTVLYQHTDNTVDNLLPYRTAVRNNARTEDLITAKWDVAVNDAIDLFVKAYWHDWDTKWDDISNDLDANGVPTGTQTIDFQDAFWGFEDYGLTASARVRTDGPFEYAFGYDYQRFWGSDDVWRIEDKTETVHAVYGQLRSAGTLFRNTDLALGLRHNATRGNVDATVWTLSGRRTLTSSLYLRGQIGTSFRLPDAEELWVTDCCERGNPDLEAEASANIEVGVGGSAALAAGLNWQIIGFARDVENLIDIAFDNPDFPDGIYANFDETAEFRGWELVLDLALNDSWSMAFDHTHSRARFAGTSEQIQDIPETVSKLALTYTANQLPLELNAALLGVGDVFDAVASGIGRIEHGGYTIVDASGTYHLDSERRHRIGVRIENLLDEEYASSLGRGRLDVDNSAYAYRNLGAPRTLHVSYDFRY